MFILYVIRRPHMILAVRGYVRSKRGISGLGKLHPHLAHGFGEGLVKESPRDEGLLRVVEDGGKLNGVTASHERHGGFGADVLCTLAEGRAQRLFLVRELAELFLQTVGGLGVVALHGEAVYEIAHISVFLT